MSGDYILAIDQGTTATTVLVVDRAGAIVGRGTAAVQQAYPHPGWVEHDPDQLWETVLAATGEALAAAHIAPDEAAAPPRRRWHHQPTRDDDSVGAGDRTAGGAGDCLAVPAHGFRLRRIAGGRAWPAVPRTDRLGARRLLLRHEDRLAAQPGPAAAAARRGRRDRLRHGGHVASVAADRRAAPRHRRHQRMRGRCSSISTACRGTTSCWRRSTCPQRYCRRCSRRPVCGRGPAQLARYRRECPSRVLPGTSKRRYSGKRASVPRRGQDHLWHRLLPADADG